MSSSDAQPADGAACAAGDVARSDGELRVRLGSRPAVQDLALSDKGRHAVLATRGGVAVIDLDASATERRVWPLEVPRLAAASRVACGKDGRLAVTSGCGVAWAAGEELLREEGGAAGACWDALQGHLRPVTALDWSRLSPDLLATCAEDCRFFIWDVRQRSHAQALLSPAPWTAAVRWSPLQDHLLATGHEDTVCVWDMRRAPQPMSVVAPGQSRVLGVDWSWHDRDQLLSVSAQPRSSGGCAGSIKVWNVANSLAATHTCIDVEDGMPSAARFLQFGPAILAAVDKSVVVFFLDGGLGRNSLTELHRHEHQHAASNVCFARRGDAEWRLVSMSQAGGSLASWNFRPPHTMQKTVIASPRMEPKQPASPEMGPKKMPTTKDLLLGRLADLATKGLEGSPFVDYTTSYHEMTECRLSIVMAIEMAPGRITRPVVIIGVNPSALSPAAKKFVLASCAKEQPVWDEADPRGGVSHRMEWPAGSTGGCDGPLVPGTVEDTFRRYLSLPDLMGDGQGLRDCVEALGKMLCRRDGPPQLLGVMTQEAQSPALEAGGKRGRSSGEPPFPRTCGACWSPNGDLLRFKSLQRLTVPIPPRWSFPDYQRVRDISKKHARNELYLPPEGDRDEHTRTALELKVDCSVRLVPATWLKEKVEDHWWTVVARDFACEPTPTMPLASDLCRHNRQKALDIGRTDLAAVWQLADSLLDGAPSSAEGPWSRPFAARLLQRAVQQLFDSQETLTLALVGVVLLCAGAALAPARGGGDVLEAEPMTRADTATTAARPRAPRRRPAGARRPEVVAHSCLATERAQLTEAINLDANGKTWAPGVERVRPPHRGLGRNASDTTMAEGPWSADSTLNACPTQLDGNSPLARQATPSGQALPVVALAVVDQRRCEEPSAAELVFRDAATVERLLHSAYAHCDLLHRLGKFGASRAMAKLVCRLQSELPSETAACSETNDEFASYKCVRLCRAPAGPDGAPGAAASAPAARAAEAAAAPAAGPTATEDGAAKLPICSVCSQTVRGLLAPCPRCGHGAHVSCFRRHFVSGLIECPVVGCSCRCLRCGPVG